MDKRTLITVLAAAALAVLAVFAKSAVMFVSASTIGLVVYLFRRARTRDKVIGIFAAGLGGSIGAEIVHTIYHYATSANPAAGDAGFYMSAMMQGLWAAAAIVVVVICTDVWLKHIAR